MSLKGYATQEQADTEIISAYAAAMQQVPAVAAAPGWFKVGSFYLPKSLERCRLEVIASVSDEDLTGTVRLYDSTSTVEAPVSGSDVSITSLAVETARSGGFSLVGDRTYFIQMQVVGASGDDQFGVLDTASLTGA
jgi:hypothetical protein